jgi:ABC-type Fe3+-hydroxamate transport system substrate-binding protein
VVSLVPSDSYSLAALGALDRVVGRTDYCVEPVELSSVATVGGTKNVDVERVIALRPDVVFANQEENTRADLVRLVGEGIKVLVAFPKTVAQGVAHLARMAVVLGIQAEAREVIAEAYRALKLADDSRGDAPPVRVFVPIWMNPLMTVHADTFISDVVELCGGHNVFADRARRYPLAADVAGAEPLPPERVGERDTRYPRVTVDEIEARQPQVILLPDEPHAFTEQDADVFRALDIPAARSGRIVFCDGKDLMWPGARSVERLDRVRRLIAG